MLPFGLRMAGKSEAKLRWRGLLIAVLFVPMLIWHFALPSFSSSSGAAATAAAEPAPAEPRSLASTDAATEPDDNTTQIRGLGAYPGFLPDMEHGYNCMSADERYDKQEISFMMVMKSHITMGGQDQSGCASGEGPCLKKGKEWLLVLYLPAMVYMFVALAIICDEFFVPSLEMFVEHYGIPMDIAGATFMAAGGSMPELFTSLISVFDESDVGFAAIVGSAVFNVLFVIAVCTLASKEPLQLTAWPLARDCLFYIIGLGLVAVMFSASSPQEIEWWEALILFIWYNCYCGFMTVNERLKRWVDSWSSKTRVVVPEQEAAKGDSPPVTAADLRTESRHPSMNMRTPSKFRSGIVKLLTQHASLAETAGIAVVTELKGTLQEAFAEMDQDEDGHIDEGEFKKFMQKLGWVPPPDRDNMKEDACAKLWKRMPLSNEDKLAFEDFRKWYTVSEARIAIEVRRVFEKLDSNGDGILDPEEIRQMMKMLGHGPTNTELGEVIRDIKRHSFIHDSQADGGVAVHEADKDEKEDKEQTPVGISYEQFEKWYSKSLFGQAHHKKHELEELEEQGFSIDWPVEDATWMQMFWYFFTYPLCAAMYCSLPDVRRPGMEGKVRWAIIEFLLSLVWIAVFSNALYECTVVCSNTIGIPPAVSGVTIIAAGTSVPDLLSSYIVAKQGEGDMAVSSSIGSNIFDITVGLPIPWMLFSMVKGGQSVKVQSKSIGFSIIILMFMLSAVVITVMCMKWRMNKPLGAVMFMLYFVFIALSLMQQLPNETNPILKVDW